jgi:hypothetical protein
LRNVLNSIKIFEHILNSWDEISASRQAAAKKTLMMRKGLKIECDIVHRGKQIAQVHNNN